MSTKHKRTAHGRAIVQVNPIPGTEDARAADAIALLSGVNAKQVLRVLAALEVLRRATESPLAYLVDTQDAPLERVEFTEDASADPENTKRAESTAALVHYMVTQGLVGELEYILRTKARFS